VTPQRPEFEDPKDAPAVKPLALARDENGRLRRCRPLPDAVAIGCAQLVDSRGGRVPALVYARSDVEMEE